MARGDPPGPAAIDAPSPVTYGGRADLCLTLLLCIPVCLLDMAAVNWGRGFI